MPILLRDLSLDQSDAIECGIAILHTCVRAAVLTLEEDKHGEIAFGLQSACFKLEDAIKVIWADPSAGGPQGCADGGRGHFDPCECHRLKPKGKPSAAVEARGAAFLASMERKAQEARREAPR